MTIKGSVAVVSSTMWALFFCAHAGSYTWTGGGAAGNWNDSANWSPSTGTPGAGDKAVFSGAAEVSITSGIALSDGTLSIETTGKPVSIAGVISGTGALCKLGAGRLALRAANTYSGGTVISNGYIDAWSMTALGTSSEPVHLASNGTTTYGKLYLCASGTFAYPILVDKNTATVGAQGNANLCASNVTVTLTGAITEAPDGGVLALRLVVPGSSTKTITVDATINMPKGSLYCYVGGDYNRTFHFKKKVVAKNMDVGNSTAGGTGSVRWYSSENEFERYHCSYRNTFAEADNAFGTNAICSFGYCENGRSVYNLQNHNFMIDRIDYSKGDACVTKWDWRNMQGHRVLGGTGTGSRLTMRSTADTVCDACYEQKIALVWWPRGDYTYSTFDNGGKGFGRIATMSGSITVSNGTFVVNGTNAFPNVDTIEVAPGAKFAWRSASMYGGGGLRGVTNIVVGQGAELELGSEAVWPFPLSVERLDLASDARFPVPAGTGLTAMRFQVGGTPLAAKVYTGRDNPSPGDAIPLDCLVGSGLVYSMGAGHQDLTTEAVWTGSGDEDMGTAANWQDDIVAFLKSGAITPIFSEPEEAGKGGRVVVSDGYVFTGLRFNGECDVDVAPGGAAARIGVLGGGISCAGAESGARSYSISTPLEVRAPQTWDVADGASLGMYGPLMDYGLKVPVKKTGAGSLILHATNSTTIAEITVATGPVHVAGSNAFGGAGGKLVLQKGAKAEFAGGEFDAGMNATLGTASGVLNFNAGTTNVFNGPVTFSGGTRFAVGQNALVEFNESVSIGGWSYLSGGGSSIMRFNGKVTLASGQHYNITYDLRAPGNSLGNEICLKYGSDTRVLLNCDYALNTTSPLWIWSINCFVDLCGHDNKIGSLELKSTASCITNSGEKATFWVEQTIETRREDNNGAYYPCRQKGDFVGPVSIGKLGASTLVFTNRAVSSTGDIIVNEGKLAFCPKTSWLGAETVIVSNKAANAGAALEIRQAKALGKHANVHLDEGGRLVLGISGTDAKFEQRIGFLYIDGAKQRLGRYSADLGGGAPAVAGTIPCANLAGPGVLNVGGDGKGTGIFLK